MQYMHFNSSCAFCCVANLLELEGRKISDTQLFREMRADLLLHREHETGTWQTGAMLQSGVWFAAWLFARWVFLWKRFRALTRRQ